eukprot:jgi/Tetstr1/424667/TSEL_015189.t1
MKSLAAADPTVAGLHARLTEALNAAGFDICVPFALKRYNEVAPEAAKVTLDSFAAGDRTLGFLFGNNRRMWPHFLAECKGGSTLLEDANPLDSYVKASVTRCLEEAAPRQPYKVFWSNDKHEGLQGGTGYVSVQRLAAGLGLCYLDSHSHLCLHPVYGSWWSLRGFVLMDGMTFDAPGGYPSVPSPLTPELERAVADALTEAMKPPEAHPEGGGATYAGVRDQWRKWLDVRRCLHDGPHPWEYDEQQVVYHYTSDRTVLRQRELAATGHFLPSRDFSRVARTQRQVGSGGS